MSQKCQEEEAQGHRSRSATTFPNCNLLRNAHAGTSMFLARFGDGITCGATASCADELLLRARPRATRSASEAPKGHDLESTPIGDMKPTRLTADAIGDSPQE